jgi:hypothetical protein
MTPLRADQRSTQHGPAEWFTGTVLLDEIAGP